MAELECSKTHNRKQMQLIRSSSFIVSNGFLLLGSVNVIIKIIKIEFFKRQKEEFAKYIISYVKKRAT